MEKPGSELTTDELWAKSGELVAKAGEVVDSDIEAFDELRAQANAIAPLLQDLTGDLL